MESKRRRNLHLVNKRFSYKKYLLADYKTQFNLSEFIWENMCHILLLG